MILFIFFFFWVAIGAYAHIYWHTKLKEYRPIDALVTLAVCWLGPIIHIVGWVVVRNAK